MLTITQGQTTNLADERRRAFVERLRALLSEHPLIASQAAAKSIEWYQWALDHALHAGLHEEFDAAEFCAQLIARGDAYLDDPLAKAALGQSTNPPWVRVRHFAQHDMLVDGGDH